GEGRGVAPRRGGRPGPGFGNRLSESIQEGSGLLRSWGAYLSGCFFNKDAPMSAAAARKLYPTDLTDLQWTIVEPLIPPAKAGGRPRQVDMREIVNAILYLNRSGCQWDMLPHDLPPKSDG